MKYPDLVDISLCNKNWDKDLIIRYLIVKLAPYFERDLKYFYASEEEQYAQYQRGFDYYNIYKVVCSTFCDFYVELFNEFNIKAYKVRANNKTVPHFVLVVEGNQGKYYIDPLQDLMRHQFGVTDQKFASEPDDAHFLVKENFPDLITLNRDYLDYLDETLKLYPNISNNDIIQRLQFEFSKRSLVCEIFGIERPVNLTKTAYKKLEFINDNIINLGYVPGPIERIQLYKYLLNKLFEKEERVHIRADIDFNNNNNLFITFDNDGEIIRFNEENYDGNFKLERVK